MTAQDEPANSPGLNVQNGAGDAQKERGKLSMQMHDSLVKFS